MSDLFKVLSSPKLGKLTEIVPKLAAVPALGAIPGLNAVVASGSLLAVMPRLISNGQLPSGVLDAGFNLGNLGDPFKKFLAWSEKPTLNEAIDWFKTQPDDPCGATTLGEPDAGSLQPLKDGRQPIMVYISEKTPLPKITKADSTPLNLDETRTVLFNGINFWAGQLKMDPAATDQEDKANLLVSGRTGGFGANVVAVGDIGPLHSKKCRLIFNLAETHTIPSFLYTVAHEFGHCLGIRHADVPRTGALMSPLMDLGPDGKQFQPRQEDLKAAEKQQWVKTLLSA